MEPQKLVNEFMKVMGQEMPDSPTIPSFSIQELRQSLIHEENKELTDAAAVKDIVEIADALCDLQYVVSGAFTAYGFSPELAKELFDEVHASNMSKLCKEENEAVATQEKYSKDGIITTRTYVDRFWVVARASDNKVMKSINWKQPDLKSILERHGVKC